MNQKLNQEWTNGERERITWPNSELRKSRFIKSDWFVTFCWLINKSSLFRCNICVSTKTSNVFVDGKDYLVKHR